MVSCKPVVSLFVRLPHHTRNVQGDGVVVVVVPEHGDGCGERGRADESGYTAGMRAKWVYGSEMTGMGRGSDR